MVIQNEDKMKSVKSVNLIKNSKKSAENTMNKFLGKLSLPKSQWDTPLERFGSSDLSLYNPNSPVACWVLYLYSMEVKCQP